MRRWMQWLGRFGWLLAGAGVGFALGAWGHVNVEPTVNVSDLLEVVATVVLAILVALLGQKRFSEDRAEKDLLIAAVRSSIEAAQDTLGVLNALISGRKTI